MCTCVNEEGGDGEVVWSETPSLLSYTLRYVSFVEVCSVFRVVFREPIHLCTCVSEEGGDGDVVCSETPSLCTCVSEEGGDGASDHHLTIQQYSPLALSMRLDQGT
jgi:hypothetical protein